MYTGVQSVKFVVHDLEHKRLLRVQWPQLLGAVQLVLQLRSSSGLSNVQRKLSNAAGDDAPSLRYLNFFSVTKKF